MKKLLVSLVLAGTLCTGCIYSEDQAGKLDALNATVASMTSDLTGLQSVYQALAGKAKDVVAKAQAGQIPAQELAALLTAIEAERTVVEAKIQAVTVGLKDAQVQYQEAAKSGVPVWQIIGSVGLNLVLGYCGMRYKGAATKWTDIAQTVIEGVERATTKGDKVRTSVRDLALDYGVQTDLDTEVQKITKPAGA